MVIAQNFRLVARTKEKEEDYKIDDILAETANQAIVLFFTRYPERLLNTSAIIIDDVVYQISFTDDALHAAKFTNEKWYKPSTK